MLTDLSVKDKKCITVAYIDYAKAFDTVCHDKLLAKLSSFGIEGNLLKYITSFLNCRTQQTRVGNALSDIAQLFSGVVQGSVLGPLLFLLFINDVTNIFSEDSVCKLYADDLKIYTELKINEDATKIQCDLDKLYEWSKAWQLQVSYKKM